MENWRTLRKGTWKTGYMGKMGSPLSATLWLLVVQRLESFLCTFRSSPLQELSKQHLERRRLCLILCKCETLAAGSRALGLGHSGYTSHMTLSMGGPRKRSLCFLTPHPPNHPTCPSVSFSKPEKFQRPEPNTGAFLPALIFCPLSVCQWVRISPPLQPTHPKESLEV